MGGGGKVLIHIYTDGGCSGNPGPGGWAYVIIQSLEPGNSGGKGAGENSAQSPGSLLLLAENWGAEKSTTNNRMELLAVISALGDPNVDPVLRKQINHKFEKIVIYTDSQYVQKGISEWIQKWKKNSWRTVDKKPVKNQDLWQELDALASGFPIVWNWVKGHSGDNFNERCDELTQKAIASLR